MPLGSYQNQAAFLQGVYVAGTGLEPATSGL